MADNPAIAMDRSLRPTHVAGEISDNPTEQNGENTATAVPGEPGRLEELELLSGALIEKAGTGSTPAHEFRIEARMYRELLRQLMLDNRTQSPGNQLPQPLLLDMVRMSALLHAAADCKTGFVIVCPTDLLQQLRSQQSRVAQALEMIRRRHE